MSSNLVTLFGGSNALTIPDYLKDLTGSATQQLLGGLGGEGRNRIGLKGNRFRLIQSGQEIAVKDEPYLDVIILGANAAISRTFYMGKFDPAVKAAPDCFSPDGVAPAKTAAKPQSSKCATCPQNEKGSKIFDNGTKGRACSFSKRLAVTMLGDTDQAVYQLDAKALSIFGDGVPSKGLYTLSEYSKLLGARGVKAEGVVTRVSFDTDSSVPKLFFTPQSFVSPEDYADISKLAKSAEVKTMLEVTADSVDLSGESDMLATKVVTAPARAIAPPAPAPAVEVEEVDEDAVALAALMAKMASAKAAKALPVTDVAPKAAAAPKAPPKAAKSVAAPVAAEAMGEDLAGLLDDLMG